MATRGSYRQYKHPTRPGRVTVAGNMNDDLDPGTLDSILKQADLKERPMRRFLIVIEKAGENYSAYSPDLPGCIATGETREAAAANMQEAIRMHVDGLREDGLPIPEPAASAEYVAVD